MRRIILPIGLIAVVVAFGAWGVQAVTEVVGLPRKAYASDWTAVFIIDHIRTTGSWPTGWQDLRDEYDRLAVPDFYAWTFDELQTIINVDWNLTVEEIRESMQSIDAIRLSGGSKVSYNGNPNDLIFDYIHTGNDPHQIYERIEGKGEQSDAPKSAVGSKY